MDGSKREGEGGDKRRAVDACQKSRQRIGRRGGRREGGEDEEVVRRDGTDAFGEPCAQVVDQRLSCDATRATQCELLHHDEGVVVPPDRLDSENQRLRVEEDRQRDDHSDDRAEGENFPIPWLAEGWVIRFSTHGPVRDDAVFCSLPVPSSLPRQSFHNTCRPFVMAQPLPGFWSQSSSDVLFGRAARRAFGPWRFLGMAILWELIFFALLRQAWVERHALGPLARAQETIAHWYGAPQRASIAVTADCSGADVMALCFGVLLAYPVSWRRRLTGMAGALAIILALNTLRIVTLLLSSPQSIQQLHLVVWPIVIVFALALYVSWWMRAADQHGESSRWRASRFAAAASGLLLLYAATAPWTMTSPAVVRAGAWTVAAGAALLQSIGLPALVSAMS